MTKNIKITNIWLHVECFVCFYRQAVVFGELNYSMNLSLDSCWSLLYLQCEEQCKITKLFKTNFCDMVIHTNKWIELYSYQFCWKTSVIKLPSINFSISYSKDLGKQTNPPDCFNNQELKKSVFLPIFTSGFFLVFGICFFSFMKIIVFFVSNEN